MRIDNLFDDIQADSEASFAAVFAVEAFEDFVGVFDPYAEVLDAKADGVIFLFECDDVLITGIAVFDGVGEGVVDDALELCGIKVESYFLTKDRLFRSNAISYPANIFDEIFVALFS